MKSSKYSICLFCFLTVVLLGGCKKIVEVDLPIDQYAGKEVYNDVTTATLALNSVYIPMSIYAGGDASISVNIGLMADEIRPSLYMKPFEYTNGIRTGNAWSFWLDGYNYIFRINSIVEGVTEAKSVANKHKQILIGEAKFLRAFNYFYLVNLYGDVPLVTSTDFRVNSNIARSNVSEIYDQIIQDLLAAQSQLSESYLNADLESVGEERIRPNKAAATALLARVYLYLKQWDKAEAESSKIISNTTLYDTVDLTNVFLKNNKEAIWQLQPNPIDYSGNTNTPDGRLYMPAFDDPFALSTFILDAFEPGDKRRQSWVKEDYVQNGLTWTIPYKYKVGANQQFGEAQPQTEYTMVLRLAEQYLIRAEARANLGNIDGAKADLNVIRVRAGLGNTSAVSQSELMHAISNERRVELFTEWGHHWFDLKRTNTIDEVMAGVTPQKTVYYIPEPSVWEPYKALLPIPAEEFKSNPALKGHQNPGYVEIP